jgi:hypothetical protein
MTSKNPGAPSLLLFYPFSRLFSFKALSNVSRLYLRTNFSQQDEINTLICKWWWKSSVETTLTYLHYEENKCPDNGTRIFSLEYVTMSGFKKKLKFCVNNFWLWGAQYPTGENLNVAWAEFSTLSLGSFTPQQRKCIVCIFLKLKTRPRFCPVSWCLSTIRWSLIFDPKFFGRIWTLNLKINCP